MKVRWLVWVEDDRENTEETILASDPEEAACLFVQDYDRESGLYPVVSGGTLTVLVDCQGIGLPVRYVVSGEIVHHYQATTCAPYDTLHLITDATDD